MIYCSLKPEIFTEIEQDGTRLNNRFYTDMNQMIKHIYNFTKERTSWNFES